MENTRPQLWTTTKAAALVIAGLMAVVGILNAFPSIFGLPTPGPYPAIILRPAIFFGCVLAYILTEPAYFVWREKGQTRALLGLGLDIAALVATAVACWQFYIVMTKLDESLYFFSQFDAWSAVAVTIAVIYLCWRAWGLPLATVAAITVFYFFTSDFWPGGLGRAGPEFVEGASQTLWFDLSAGILGSITSVMILVVFVFIVFGQLLEGTGAGMSLIRVAFHLTRRVRGGPAHAAIVSSGLFGTMSGNALANVVGTGVLTIPMMKRAGFPPHFAGAVEATASSAGQIMPPVMGAAAFVLADIVGMSYLNVITAALVPAMLYYTSLFAAVYFESGRLNIKPDENIDENLRMGRQDVLNLSMVFAPVVVMVMALNMGFSAAGGGIFALFTTLIFSFINPEIRSKPWKLIVAFGEGGLAFAKMMIAVAVIGIVVSVLGATGLPTDFANMVARVASDGLMFSLIIAMLAALLLGMGMPTLPAYLTIALVLGPTLRQFGLSDLSLHLFVLYYGVASSITPPVAITAYAAAAIAEGPPLKTSIFAYKVGIVKFIVPFVFVFYPVLLIVDESGFDMTEFALTLFRVVVAIFTLSSALTGFDAKRLGMPEILLRVVAAIGCLILIPTIHWPATALCIALLVLNRGMARRTPTAA
ncbi:TRAP transporter permease [Cognatishimia sp.]|uniref:TRAP transporter permease n=1 Tax=Cognatishimia sp. TaxID=2211648 RepID=UPI003511EB5B|nr:TRAP transporter fused permease subunit [Cognatishimia sp.]